MPSSINGWPVLGSPPWDDKRLTRLKVPGTPCVVYARKSVAPLFAALALDYHQTIHPLTGRDDVDAYDYRQARAANAWSDHSSGTAIDIRASAEGAQGSENYSWWKGAHAAAARTIKARYEIVMWGGATDLGGDYGNPKYWDWMHWALRPGTSQADVDRIIAKLGIKPDGTRTATVTGEKPSTPTQVSPNQQVQIPAATGKPQTYPTGSGPYWLLRWLRAHSATVGVFERAWWAIIMRESNAQPGCLYPAGAPWGDWKHGGGRHFDTGMLQVNDRHFDQVAVMFPGEDMRAMLDPEKAWKFAQKHLQWSDWGLVISADGKSFSFDWSGWPSPYRPGESGAVDAEKSFRYWWDQYPVAVKKVYG